MEAELSGAPAAFDQVTLDAGLFTVSEFVDWQLSSKFKQSKRLVDELAAELEDTKEQAQAAEEEHASRISSLEAAHTKDITEQDQNGATDTVVACNAAFSAL